MESEPPVHEAKRPEVQNCEKLGSVYDLFTTTS